MKWTTGPYTVGPPQLRAEALMHAKSARQRQLILGTVPWSAGDKPKWNKHNYQKGHLALINRLMAAGIEARLVREHVPRPESRGATHRLVLVLGPRDEWACDCYREGETTAIT